MSEKAGDVINAHARVRGVLGERMSKLVGGELDAELLCDAVQDRTNAPGGVRLAVAVGEHGPFGLLPAPQLVDEPRRKVQRADQAGLAGGLVPREDRHGSVEIHSFPR